MTVAGLAWDRGMIRDVQDRVKDYVDDGGFDSPHNAQITWDHFLRQTNEWDGTLWDKHYSAGNTDDELRQPVQPGTYYEYNDVRVNRLSLSLLHVWRRPLPEVLKELVMDPINASDTWQWHGYRNSWVMVDGIRMQSVSGGGHWGVACGSPPATWPALAISRYAADAGKIDKFSPSAGSRWPPRQRLCIPPTGS